MSPVQSWPSAPRKDAQTSLSDHVKQSNDCSMVDLPSQWTRLRGAPKQNERRGVAQLARATGLGPVGRRFKSCHPDNSAKEQFLETSAISW